MGTSIGILLPWGLERHGGDPAFGSGPVATIIQDVLSLLIDFLMVQLLGVRPPLPPRPLWRPVAWSQRPPVAG